MNKDTKTVGFVISLTIFFAFLIVNMYVILFKDAILAKALAVMSSCFIITLFTILIRNYRINKQSK